MIRTVDVELEIRNYRCFPDDRPAKIRIRSGLTGFVGINNAGKSTVLRLLYELRHMWQRVTPVSGLDPALRRANEGRSGRFGGEVHRGSSMTVPVQHR